MIIFIYIIFFLLSICSFSPTDTFADDAPTHYLYWAHDINRSDYGSSILIFDPDPGKIVDTVKIPDHLRTVTVQILFDDKNIFVQMAHVNKAIPEAIYRINSDRKIEKIGEARGNLIGFDSQYVFLTQAYVNFKSEKNPRDSWEVQARKIDLSSKKITENHFDDNPDFNVVNVQFDTQRTWYAGTIFQKEHPSFANGFEFDRNFGPYGQTVLISKDKVTGTTEKFDLGTEGAYLLQTIIDPEFIWVFQFNPLRSQYQILKFSKTDKRTVSSIETGQIEGLPKTPQMNLRYRHPQGTITDQNYFWVNAYQGQSMVRIEKETFKTAVNSIANNYWIGSDMIEKGDTIWMMVYSGRVWRSSGPGLVKMSQIDMKSEFLPLHRTFWTGLREILAYFVSHPVGSILIGVVVAYFFYFILKNVRWEKMDGALKKACLASTALNILPVISLLSLNIGNELGWSGVELSGIEGIVIRFWAFPLMMGPIIAPLGFMFGRLLIRQSQSEELSRIDWYFSFSNVLLLLWFLGSGLFWLFLHYFKT